MDRREREREKNQKKRGLAKKKACAALARRPDPEQLLLRAATASAFGPDENDPERGLEEAAT